MTPPLPLVPWLLEVPRSLAAASDLVSVLDEAEASRLAGIGAAGVAAGYLVAHVGLRVLLGRFLDCAPAEITFGRDACSICGERHGKPTVAGADVHFSLSHSGDLVVIVTSDRPVGADVERLRPGHDRRRVTTRLHPTEQRVLGAAPAAEREGLFVDCWARKEAYLKAIGTGLVGGLERDYVGFSGDLAPDAPLAVLPDRWRCVPVEVPAGYRAALATQYEEMSCGADAATRLVPDIFVLGLT